MTLRIQNRRGSALLTAACLTTLLALAIATVLYLTNQSRIRAINVSRSFSRGSCAESGLEIAKAYYGQRYNNWNNFLANAQVYNNLPLAIAAGQNPPGDGGQAFLASNPNLFADLDGDGLPDVYFYVRDNFDEFPSDGGVTLTDYTRDNDLMVVVGGLCVSSTMVPKLESGRISSQPLMVEGLLSYNNPGACNLSNATVNNSGNLNGCSP